MAKKSKHLEPLRVEQHQTDTPPAGITPPLPTDSQPVIHFDEITDINSLAAPPSMKAKRTTRQPRRPGIDCTPRMPDAVSTIDAPKQTEPQNQNPQSNSQTNDHNTTPKTGDETGDSPSPAVAAGGPPPAYARSGEPENRMGAKWRWARENRLADIEEWMERKRSELRDTGMARHRANDLAWEAAIREFPPPGQLAVAAETPPPAESPKPESMPLQGLGSIPESWPPLPDNASLQAELGWVQSQRLSIVEERGNRTIVRLELASTPAPSKAALGWLETSIRSYAKYVDVVSRTLAGAQDEQESIRRERMAIEDIRALLREMRQA
jgi:hypothetical protein